MDKDIEIIGCFTLNEVKYVDVKTPNAVLVMTENDYRRILQCINLEARKKKLNRGKEKVAL